MAIVRVMSPTWLSRLQREPVAGHEGQARTGRAPAHRLANEASNRFPSATYPSRLARLAFAFHDDAEIGPEMLARIAAKTGLKPKDL